MGAAPIPASGSWEWEDDRGRWRGYDPGLDAALEQAFLASAADVDLGGRHGWRVDFARMVQINTASTGAERNVRRVGGAPPAPPAAPAAGGAAGGAAAGGGGLAVAPTVHDLLVAYGLQEFEDRLLALGASAPVHLAQLDDSDIAQLGASDAQRSAFAAMLAQCGGHLGGGGLALPCTCIHWRITYKCYIACNI